MSLILAFLLLVSVNKVKIVDSPRNKAVLSARQAKKG
jgi:hypothetical protein